MSDRETRDLPMKVFHLEGGGVALVGPSRTVTIAPKCKIQGCDVDEEIERLFEFARALRIWSGPPLESDTAEDLRRVLIQRLETALRALEDIANDSTPLSHPACAREALRKIGAP